MNLWIIGTLINAAAVLIGGGVGLLFKGRVPEKISANIMRAIGLCVCILGISEALKGDLMLLVVSLALGAFVGELLHLEDGLNQLGRRLQKMISRKEEGSTFADGFITATLLFCVGAMSVIGSIDSGLNNRCSNIILTKSILDGIGSLVLASSFGVGVLFSAAVILVYQGSLEFFAGYLQNVLTNELITQVSAVGGVMILGIGLNMVLNAKIRVVNLLPGLLFGVGYYYLSTLPLSFWQSLIPNFQVF